MFSIAYVILPFSDAPPADAVRVSLARFQRGRHGDLPESWLTFHDETEEFRQVHEANHIFTEQDDHAPANFCTIKHMAQNLIRLAPRKASLRLP